MLFFAVILAVAFSASYEQCTDHFLDKADAEACCTGQGLQLCSYNQLFQVVFGTDDSYKQTQMCFSAHMSDSVGWWNADDAFCSGYGFKSYADPNGPGAHCCSADIPAPAPMTCQMAGPASCTGTRILLDTQLDRYCPDGDCTDDFCCQDFTPAEVYKLVGTQYDFATADEAMAGCVGIHPDYQLCTKTQIIALYAGGYGEPVCTSGWHVADDDEDEEYARGWYNNEETAANNFCGGKTGWRAWAPPSGEGSAHCCVPSYTKGSGYNSLGNLAGMDIDTKQEIARAHCEASSYPYKLCTQRQLFQVAFTGEAENICMSGILEDPLSEDADDATCGWEQVSTDCGNGSTGWKGWCPDNTGAHCCLDYVSGWYPEYTYATSGYDIYPAEKNYAESTFNNGAAANTWCMDQEYAGICSVEQVKYVAENQGSYGSLGCAVGWSTETDGSYVSGFWGTQAACGRDDGWYDKWQPTAPQYPTAHCCAETVPESPRAPAVKDPLIKQVSTYVYASFSAAEGNCDAEMGYSTCTRDQVETVATVGTERSDGTMQTETNLCYQGYMADGSKGWYQTDMSCGGKTGWRSFNGDAGLFCCLDFEAKVGTEAPTKAPATPVYQFIGEYVYQNEEEASLACKDVTDAYDLCNDDEVYTIAMFGQEVTAEGFEGLEANTACKSGWVDSASSAPYTIGWFQSDPVCGGGRKFLQWNSWALVDAESSSGYSAGAHCCVSNLIDSQSHPAGTSAPSSMPTTTTTTTTTTVLPETTTAPSALPTEWVATSDLPSTAQPPANCEDRPDLVPMGFEGVIQYCATDDLIYINGRTTCVDPTEADAEALVSNAFQNDWYFTHGTCEGRKDYDLATDDQLYVTNHMLDDLETDIDELESEMAAESSDLDAYLETWKTEVASLITDNMSNFDATTQAALQAYIESNLGSD